MSARIRCVDCGWHQRYTDPRDARRAATHHYCDTPPTGGPSPISEPSPEPAETGHGDG